MGLKAEERARKTEQHKQEHGSDRSTGKARHRNKAGKDRDETGKGQETKPYRASYYKREQGSPFRNSLAGSRGVSAYLAQRQTLLAFTIPFSRHFGDPSLNSQKQSDLPFQVPRAPRATPLYFTSHPEF